MGKISGCALKPSIGASCNVGYGFMCLCCPGPQLGVQSSQGYTGALFVRLSLYFWVGSCNISGEASAMIAKCSKHFLCPYMLCSS